MWNSTCFIQNDINIFLCGFIYLDGKQRRFVGVCNELHINKFGGWKKKKRYIFLKLTVLRCDLVCLLMYLLH